MAIDAFNGQMHTQNHIYNGGMWFYGLTASERVEVFDTLSTLPYMIEVNTKFGTVGIIHADVVFGDWAETLVRLRSDDPVTPNVVMWSRDRMQSKEIWPVTGIDHLIVGHNVVDEVTKLANVVHIDTGGCFKSGKLTVKTIEQLIKEPNEKDDNDGNDPLYVNGLWI